MPIRRSDASRLEAFTLIELMVTMAVIGVLAAILLPAVQQARESARRSTCQNKLKQLGLATMNYESAYGRFPPGVVTTRHGTPASNCELLGFTNQESRAPWSVLLLPFLEQTALYDSFDFSSPFFGLKHPIAGTANDGPQCRPNPLFQCPSDPNSTIAPANSNYFAVQGGGAIPDCRGNPPYEGRVFFYNGAFYVNSSTRISDLSDGASTTAILGETRYLQLLGPDPLYEGTWASSIWYGFLTEGSLYVTIAAMMDPPNRVPLVPSRDWTLEYQTRTFGSWHPGGLHFVLGDGHVTFLSDSIDLGVYRKIGARNDGQAVELPD